MAVAPNSRVASPQVMTTVRSWLTMPTLTRMAPKMAMISSPIFISFSVSNIGPIFSVFFRIERFVTTLPVVRSIRSKSGDPLRSGSFHI